MESKSLEFSRWDEDQCEAGLTHLEQLRDQVSSEGLIIELFWNNSLETVAGRFTIIHTLYNPASHSRQPRISRAFQSA